MASHHSGPMEVVTVVEVIVIVVVGRRHVSVVFQL